VIIKKNPMESNSYPRPETVPPSRSALRELVRQLKQTYPALRGESITEGYVIHPRDIALLNAGYCPFDGAAWRFLKAVIDVVGDSKPESTELIAFVARTLRDAPRKPKKKV